MTTNIAAPLPPTRQDPRQVVNDLKKIVNWNDVNLATGVAFANSLPQFAFITGVFVEIVTPFNGTSPSLVIGTNGPTNYNNIVAAGDVDETIAGVTQVTRAIGRGVTAGGPVVPFAKFTVGGSPTQGQAVILITFEGGFPS